MANFLDDYEPVEDRLREFWKDHPEGRVMTTLIAHADSDYIVFAEVWRAADEWPAASGLAHDSEAQLPPNMKASALEVCETSAIGRALANMGYAAKGKRPSREEMSKTSPVAGGLSQAPALDPGDSSSGEAQNPPGRDAGQPSPGSSPPSSAIGETATASVQGEVADAGPGGQSNPPGSTKPPPVPPGAGPGGKTPPRPYPFDPTTCTHKMPSGRWMRWDKDDRCPKCGTPKVSAVEGTTADLSA